MTHSPEPQSHLHNHPCGKQDWVAGAYLGHLTLSGVRGKAFPRTYTIAEAEAEG